MASSSRPSAVQTDKCPPVFVAQSPHQGGKTLSRVTPADLIFDDHRKSDGMDSDSALTASTGFVDAIDLLNHRLNGIAAEFIAEYINTDFFILGVEGLDGGRDAFNRTAVAK